MMKSELLYWLEGEYQKFLGILDQIDPMRLEQPGVNGEWTMKDMLAHLNGWNLGLIADFTAAQKGEPPPPPPWPKQLQTWDEINAWIYETYHERSISEVMEETRNAFQQLFSIVESLPEDVQAERSETGYYTVWLSEKSFPPGEYFRHYHEEHEPDVRAWLASQEKN
jgi:hypothetical protein